MREITIVYRFLPQYRVDFFNGLREELASKGLQLRLVYGKGRMDSAKQDERDLSWGMPIANREFVLVGKKFFWQPVPESIWSSDLIILMQETKILSNFALLAKARMRQKKIAFWGHGKDFQSDPASLANTLKEAYSRWVDWWFAYTRRVAEIVASTGFPRQNITVVENAIDTRSLIEAKRRMSKADVTSLRKKLGIGTGPVGIFCSSMYAEKRLPFLIRACRELRRRIPTFGMIFIGAGPGAPQVKDFAAECSWARYVGPKFGIDRVPYFMLADVVLMPGLVGLGILDCFALETPLITTNYPFHSPEIDYLKAGCNGIMSRNELSSFVNAAQLVLTSESLLRKLIAGCRESAANYSTQKMVTNFANGIYSALDIPISAEA